MNKMGNLSVGYQRIRSVLSLALLSQFTLCSIPIIPIVAVFPATLLK
jgi:hypothetical protein